MVPNSQVKYCCCIIHAPICIYVWHTWRETLSYTGVHAGKTQKPPQQIQWYSVGAHHESFRCEWIRSWRYLAMHKVPPSARALFADLQRARESLKQRTRRAMGTWPECQRLARLLNNSKPRATGSESLDLALSFCRVHLVAERLTLRPGRSTHLIYSAAGQGKQTEKERIATQSTNVFCCCLCSPPTWILFCGGIFGVLEMPI